MTIAIHFQICKLPGNLSFIIMIVLSTTWPTQTYIIMEEFYVEEFMMEEI